MIVIDEMTVYTCIHVMIVIDEMTVYACDDCD